MTTPSSHYRTSGDTAATTASRTPRGWAKPGQYVCEARLAEDVTCGLRAEYRHKWHTDGSSEWTDEATVADANGDLSPSGGAA